MNRKNRIEDCSAAFGGTQTISRASTVAQMHQYYDQSLCAKATKMRIPPR
jgi:hypothetical protein